MPSDAIFRRQLVEARERILAQIEDLIHRARSSYEEGPPDYRSVYAELQDQLREIDELIGTDEHESHNFYERGRRDQPSNVE